MDVLKALTFISSVVGIPGFFVGIWGIYATYKSKRTQIMEYCLNTSPIITNRINNIPGLQIAVGGEFASDLTLTKIDFTNRGNTNINHSDFATLAPLQILSTGHFFNLQSLNEDIISSNNPNLNSKIEVVDSSTLELSFEYLKPKQFFSISVFHDGEISVSGDLKSGKLRQRQDTSLSEEKNSQPRNSTFMLMLCTNIFLAIVLGLFIYVGSNYVGSNIFKDPILSISYGIEDNSTAPKNSISNAEYIEMKSNLERILKELELQQATGTLDAEQQIQFYYLAAEYYRMIANLTLQIEKDP